MDSEKAKLLEMEARMVFPSNGDWVVGDGKGVAGGGDGKYWSSVQIR